MNVGLKGGIVVDGRQQREVVEERTALRTGIGLQGEKRASSREDANVVCDAESNST